MHTRRPRGPRYNARMPRILAPLLPICLLVMLVAAAPASASQALSAALLQRAGEEGLAAPPLEDGDRPRIAAALFDLYAARDWRSLWFDGTQADRTAGAGRLAAALAVLADAARDGLAPVDYATGVAADALGDFVDRADADALAALELRAAVAILTYARDAAIGRVGPRISDPNVFAETRSFDAHAFARDVLADPAADIASALTALHPGHPEYRGLRRALSLARALAAKPEPPAVAPGPSLKPGMRDPRVAALRARLAHLGDISVPEAEPALFTPALEIALKSFQRRHGLEADGFAGKLTLAAVNRTAADRVETILLNMERWRWLPRALGENYVLANIAGFEVTMVEGGSVVDRMAAVVGRPYRMSPVFSDAISYIELNPTWTVPPKIAREDLLAKIQADPTYLAAGGYQVFSGWGADAVALDPAAIDWARVSKRQFPYKLRQGAGPKNALGQVKIMFPNRFDVYLHDSPARELYAKSVRAFSSGCIRLSRPFDLVDWLMRLTGGPDRPAIQAMLETGETRIVKLAARVPVHLIYATAWAGEDGQMHFRDDVYGRDALLKAALAR